ncbi:hypothetical protein C9E85_14750 [Plesiomonas shigelloides]|uniref:hypothetical protein n=1 Tax=Plesiomonas shigelloides TaxID=703 RepID=UPI000D5731C7|nr:hypothetical protein [Plesiomonas shigelloides]PVU65090.1 hypothetical protein C9E85_14750 [Plesiomonas shigelloides]
MFEYRKDGEFTNSEAVNMIEHCLNNNMVYIDGMMKEFEEERKDHQQVRRNHIFFLLEMAKRHVNNDSYKPQKRKKFFGFF